jgi:predicted ATPase
MRWRVRLFDGPVLEGPSGELVTRFRSKRVGALLAYLALQLGKHCPREELADAIWPDEPDAQVVANRLRVALASLRHQMEPAPVPFGSVLDVSIPGCVALRSDAVWCDAVEADIHFQGGKPELAVQLMSGSLLPGYTEEWVELERYRLEALAEGVKTSTSEPAAPVLLSEEIRRTSTLPLYLTRFFGREKETTRLLELLESNRLVTVLGPGGAGKTRLSIHTAAQMGGTPVFVSLAAMDAGGDVGEAVLRGLLVRPALSGDLLDQAIEVLAQRKTTLLVLDNAEHVIEPVAESVMCLLQELPGLAILVTSRHRLELPGEQILPLGPLDIPSGELSSHELANSAAGALWLDRAMNARPDFVLQESQRAPVLEIFRLVDGMPLALELAAARVVSQNPSQIAETLRLNLIDLKSRQRGLSARHQSIRASIAGSFELLDPAARAFLAQLTIFRAGWTAAAAKSVTGNEDSALFLEELTGRSLLVFSGTTAEPRFSFLESIRQFAYEQVSLVERGELAQKHAYYYLGLAAAVSEDDVSTLLPLDEEQENLLQALATGRTGDVSLFAHALAGTLTFAHVRGRHRTYLSCAEEALDLAGRIADVELRVSLRVAAYFVVSFVGDIGAVRRIGELILEDSHLQGFLKGVVLGKIVLGFSEFIAAHYSEAIDLTREALRQARAIGEAALVWRSLRMAAFVIQGSVLRGFMGEADALALLGEAESLSHECLSTLPLSSAHRTFEWLTLNYVFQQQGRLSEAQRALKNAQHTAIAHGIDSLLLFCLREECLLEISAKNYERAGLAYGGYMRLKEDTGYNTISGGDDSIGAITQALWDALGETRFGELALQGRRMTASQIVGATYSG